MSYTPGTTAFNRMAAQHVEGFISAYGMAVSLGDVAWLEKNVPDNKALTPDNRGWLANLEIPGVSTAFSIHAINEKNHRLLGFLLREGASPDIALPHALMARDAAAVKLLCDAKVDIDTTYQGVPLLNISAVLNDAESCGHLIDAHADVNGYRNNDKQCTALFDCIGKYEQEVSKAFAAGTSEGEISSRAQQPALRTIGLLLERGADEHQKNEDGLSAYELAKTFSGVDPRPLELIHEWRSGAAAKAELNDIMARMRKPNAGLR